MKFETISNQESIESKLERLPIELLPARSQFTIADLRESIPKGRIIVCDFYVKDIEGGEENDYGFSRADENVINIDHHAPSRSMSRYVSSANLAVRFVESEGSISSAEDHVVINHTDCDSVLSSSIIRGILPPDKIFEEAAIAADHTGALNEVADLLQSLQDKRDLTFSLQNLDKLLKGEKIDEEAQSMLEARLKSREMVKKIVSDGKFEKNGQVYFTSVDERFDAGMLPAILPDAAAIVLGSPMKDNPDMWEIKVRLGLSASQDMALNEMNLPDFGGRWNAGSTKRHGGTKLNPEEYAKILNNSMGGKSTF